MQDLGTLGGTLSYGASHQRLGAGDGRRLHGRRWTVHAFLWDGTTLQDLNALIDPADPLQPFVTLVEGVDINDLGQILANGFDSRTGELHAYLVSPIVSPSAMLSQLLASVTGIGPGKSLADKIALAQMYYAVPDIASTCSMLGAFIQEANAQTGKKLTPEQATMLVAEAEAIMDTVGCE